MSLDSNYISPYQILGVKEDDSLSDITKVYKNLMRILHPDKSNTSGYQELNLSIEKRIEAFRNVKNAYTNILKYRKESQYPDYNLDYFIEQELKQNLQNTDYTVQDTTPENFNVNIFNNKFSGEKELHEKNGMADPYSRGYEMFSTKNMNDSGPVKIQPRKAIDVSTPKTFSSNEIVNYLPKEAAVLLGETSSIGYQELGITTVDDFSMVTGSCKGKLCGSDLMSVYGKNKENWEDSVSKNKQLFDRYNDDTDLTKKMNSIQGSRAGIYSEPLDKDIQKKIDEDIETAKMMENIRQRNLQKVEGYYTNYTKGQITLPRRN